MIFCNFEMVLKFLGSTDESKLQKNYSPSGLVALKKILSDIPKLQGALIKCSN